MSEPEIEPEMERGGNMSFLEHLDELRRRLVNVVVIVILSFMFCWFVSDEIYDFLSVPIRKAISEAEQNQVPVTGLTGEEKVLVISDLKEGDRGRYVFDRSTRLGTTLIQPGTSVNSIVVTEAAGTLALFTDEPLIAGNSVVPAGIKLPIDLSNASVTTKDPLERLIVTTATEPFTLYVTVSLYAAIALALPFILLQIWGFISPALYKHERGYVTPFVLLSSISFVAGAAFAYYILFPPAVKYLLWLGSDFQLLLRASDYFDLITLIMLAMGLIFQMPAITYVLARIGIVTAGFLARSWKIAIVVILIVAAVVSPTGDIPNLMLFATPMFVLYAVSIGIAWIFGKKRSEVAN
ncbi:MAG TPA: twin-arginine translocase subunit TatC [Pyrinomonadaceae bacterium]|nr:twin-arginine translocase subunit TatC [Pyrinomonadaceae bacterium]